MKRTILIISVCFLGADAILAQQAEPQAMKWNLVTIPATDETNLKADANWKVDSKSRYCYTPAMNNESVIANGVELEMVKGLKFTIPVNSDGSLRFGGTTKAMWMGNPSASCTITIPNCKKGQFVVVEYMTSKKGTTRTLTSTNLVTELPSSSSSSTHEKAQAKIAADGDVTLTVGQGMYFYSLAMGDSLAIFDSGNTGGGSESEVDNPDNPKDVTHCFDITQDFSQLHSNIYGNGPKIYVSPDGNDANDGSQVAPYASIQKAVDMAVEPGTTIILAPGEYRPTDRINIDDRNGTHDNYNAMVCLDGRATINCNHPQHAHSDNPYQGVRLTSSYWYFYHVDITNASDNGLLIERNKPTGGTATDVMNANDQAHDNIIEACNFYKNGDTGLQMKNLAAYNYIINCDSYLNCDIDQGDADGFAPKISVGTGNYFFGCRAYLNSDDGWDVFYKNDSGFGDNMTIILDHCISYKNGFLDENTIAADGNGNGFKCGSNQGAMNVYLNRCLAISNKLKGFDQNHNSGDIILNNCTGYVNTAESFFSGYADKAYSYRIFEDIASGHKVELTNCIAINDNDEKDKRDSSGVAKESEHGKNGNYARFQIDETLDGLTVKTSEFQKARPEFFKDLDLSHVITARDANDNLMDNDFAQIAEDVSVSYKTTAKTNNAVTVNSASLIDTGTPVETSEYLTLPVPPIIYNGTAPDLGAYETGTATGIARLNVAHAKAGKLSFMQTNSGILLLTIEDAKLSDVHTVSISTLDGRQLSSQSFRGSATSLVLPQINAPVIISVKGSLVNEALKVICRAR